MDIDLKLMGIDAKEAFKQLALAESDQKNKALSTFADMLEKDANDVLRENQQDIEAARKSGLSLAMLDRLSLQDGRLGSIAKDVRHIASLPDPIGEEFDVSTLPNGLKLSKRRVPIGVIGVIYESRPNVTVDVAALSIKTGNCAILRGGTETLRTNHVLAWMVQQALASANLPEKAIQLIESTERSLVKELLRQYQYIDLIIPRGGAALHQFCRENSTIPVITGGIGVCHLFVDESADLEASLNVIHNAKTQRPTVCNALDTVLVNEEIAAKFLPQLAQKLLHSGVQFRVDQKAWDFIGASPNDKNIQMAIPSDWDTEWMNLTLGIKIVASLEEAIDHIKKHSTGHSDGILTNNPKHTEIFLRQVDSAAVYVNASTRFTDGGQFGLGAEVAISTQKIHARGPMGLRELTSYKWIVQGNYHTRP